ncbi:MAG: hypothetical protein U1E76_25235 [Planctomycetota bacterium]
MWQIALFLGLVLWLVLMLRGLWPALARRDSARGVVLMFTLASTVHWPAVCRGLPVLLAHPPLLDAMEYWRWWVVHLWVEGFFEVFATTALAFVFVRLGLVVASTPARRCWRPAR